MNNFLILKRVEGRGRKVEGREIMKINFEITLVILGKVFHFPVQSLVVNLLYQSGFLHIFTLTHTHTHERKRDR